MSITEGIPAVPIFTPEDARRAVLKRSPEENLKSASRDGRTRQGSLLVMVPIRRGEGSDPGEHYAALETVLSKMKGPRGEDLELNPVIPFLNLRTVHFARILLHTESPSTDAPIPPGKKTSGRPDIPAKLLFATDFDGSLKAHLDELLCVAGPGLDWLFDHCEGWPGHRNRKAALRFLRRHSVRSNTFYTSTQRRTVEQIRREADLRQAIDGFLDREAGQEGFPTDPVDVRDRICKFVEGQPELAWTKVEPGPFPTPPIPKRIRDNLGRSALRAAVAVAVLLAGILALSLYFSWAQKFGTGLGIAVALGVALLLVALPLAALVRAGFRAWAFLQQLEKNDPEIVRDDVKEHTRQLVQTEDRIVQNEMSSVLYIKEPLRFRHMVLWLVLAFIDFSARYISVEGRLAGIPSIHFARWVIVDGGRRLVFFSNYDGSWESYLGDFVDKSPGGLTAVWSNCVGFPRSERLLGEGARNEQLFKAYVRDSQIPTQVWYSAYRWLSVSNINDNSKIRLGLYGDMDRAQAEEWLRRFGGGEKLAVSPPQPPAEAVPVEEVAVDDVQGLVARSYSPLRYACYVPVRFGEEAAARAWLDDVRGNVTDASVNTKAAEAQGWALNLAFTAHGLSALGLAESALGTFSREFTEGMATPHRQRILGDAGDTGPENWRWGAEKDSVHAMLFLFAGTDQRLKDMLRDERERGTRHGVTLDEPLTSIMLPDDKEHFGFHDGIAQPRIAGLKSDSSREDGPPIPAGEVVLGYTNAYGRKPASPSVAADLLSTSLLGDAVPDPFDTSASATRRDLGRNGTYVVFRTLEQDVKKFWSFVNQRAEGNPDERKRLAAKIVGRWPNGAPLVTYPRAEPPVFDAKGKEGNDFLYTANGDQHGTLCPIGAHIRRTNPRDGMVPHPVESLKVADRHRLLRRGRAYGAPVVESFDPDHILVAADERARQERGLHFICFNTDIGRQFEFVQHTWVNGMKFDGLFADPDPLIAPHVDPADAKHPEEVSNFTIQGCPVRHRETGLTRFVTMRGGAYLFMPGMKALEYLAKMP
jgi:Dyp-type peroxidase family